MNLTLCLGRTSRSAAVVFHLNLHHPWRSSARIGCVSPSHFLYGILNCCLGPRNRHSGPFTVLYSRCQLTSRFVFQPFLTPVPPLSNDVLAKALLPFRYLLGVARTLLVLGLALIYLVLVQGICLVFVRSSHPPALLLADFTTVPYTTNISTIRPYIYIYSWTHGSFHSWSVLCPSRAVQ